MSFRLQSSFTNGEIGEKMLARVDYEGYFKGALKLRNVIVLPQGGARRRFGTTYVGTLSGINDDSYVKMVVLEYSDEDYYLIVFKAIQILVYHDDALVAGVVSPYLETDVAKLDFVQTVDSLLITHEDFAPRHFRRTAAHAGWSLTTPSFKEKPGYDFTRNYNTFIFALQKAGGAAFDKDENQSGKGVRFISDNDFFTADMVGGSCFMYGGVVRYTTFQSALRMDGTLTHIFDMKVDSTLTFDVSAIPGGDVVSTEPCFSAARGYPSLVENYQNRVIFANSPSLHDGLFASAFNGFYNDQLDFDDSKESVDSAFTIQIASYRTDALRAILGSTTLLAFSKSGEHSTNPLNDKGFSYESGAFLQQASEGIAINIKPVDIDGKILFVEEGGKIIRGLSFVAQKQKFEAMNLSLLSSHLIRTPRKIVAYKNPEEIDGQFLLCINSEDGSLAILQLIEQEKILAWSLSTTPGAQGEFITVASAGNKTYFLVKRNVNGTDYYYIERLDFNVLTDCTISGTQASSPTITGLDHLEDEEVKILVGNRVVGTETVSGHEVTVDENITSYQVGLNFVTEIQPMPIAIPLGEGLVDIYGTKHINTVYVDYYESLGILVNGEEVPFRDFGDLEAFDPTPKSGVYAKTIMNGWNPRQTVSITQAEPYPMTIRGIGYSLDFDAASQ